MTAIASSMWFALPWGCGRVHDLSVPSQPLLTLHGHVDRASLTRVNPDAALIAALAWAAVPAVNPVCLPWPPPIELEGECPDPYGVVEGELSPAVPVDANGDFDLTLLDLPKVSLSVGDASTRIAYGSLIVVEDVDGDGQTSFPKVVTRRNNTPYEPPSGDAAIVPDQIVASTFYSLRAPQRRIAFREGGFVSPSNFYPACQWSAADGTNLPPAGFSFLDVPPNTDPLPPPEACGVTPIDTRITVPAISPDEGLALLCRPVQEVESLVRRPPNDALPPHVCRGPLAAVLFNRVPCSTLESYALVGCGDDPGCASPEWDSSSLVTYPWPCP